MSTVYESTSDTAKRLRPGVKCNEYYAKATLAATLGSKHHNRVVSTAQAKGALDQNAVEGADVAPKAAYGVLPLQVTI